MAMRPLATKQTPSLVAQAVGLALSPVVYSLHIGSALLGWACTNLSATMQLPLRVLTAVLQIADSVICELLAWVSKEPGLKAQVCCVYLSVGCAKARWRSCNALLVWQAFLTSSRSHSSSGSGLCY